MTLARYWTGTIDAEALEEAAGLPCRAQVIGADAFASPYSGAMTFAADATPHTHFMYAPELGILFSITLEFVPLAKLTAILNKLAARIAANQAFRVVVTDGFQAIDVEARCAMPLWYSRGEPSGGYIAGVTFNFVTSGA